MTGLTAVATLTYTPLPIAEFCDNQAISGSDDTGAGHFNVWGNSFPAAELPAAGSRIEVAGTPFDLPERTPGRDNVRCAGQLLPVPTGRYDWIHLLAAAERRTEDTVGLHFVDGDVDFEALRISDFWAAEARFGERTAFATTVMHYPHHIQPRVPALMWHQRIPVSRPAPLTAIRLPRNVAVHIFAVTLLSAGEAA